MNKVNPAAPAKRASKPAPARRAVAGRAASKAAPANKPSKAPRKKPVATAEKVVVPSAAHKPAKLRVALVRDGFTMPEADFALIGALKSRALAGRRETKKSELLRAGLRALAELDGASLVAALNRLEPVKTGRPKKGH